jgi:translation initiation factor 1
MKNNGLVYSTEHGRMCPECNFPISQCQCARGGEITSAGDGIVRLHRQTKGRGGKTVTIIAGIAPESTSLKKLCKELKQKCSSGGTVKDGIIEIQGDHREKLIELLRSKGYVVKQAGG